MYTPCGHDRSVAKSPDGIGELNGTSKSLASPMESLVRVYLEYSVTLKNAYRSIWHKMKNGYINDRPNAFEPKY